MWLSKTSVELINTNMRHGRRCVAHAAMHSGDLHIILDRRSSFARAPWCLRVPRLARLWSESIGTPPVNLCQAPSSLATHLRGSPSLSPPPLDARHRVDRSGVDATIGDLTGGELAPVKRHPAPVWLTGGVPLTAGPRMSVTALVFLYFSFSRNVLWSLENHIKS
jgi:hypothetical protein